MTTPQKPKLDTWPQQLDAPARAFLIAQGKADCRIDALVGDASSRRYFRLRGEGMLLMDDASDPEGFGAYLMLSRHLNALGLSAPQVRAAEPATGLALVEDFGDFTYARCLAAGEDETALYRLAVDALLHLHHAPSGNAVARPAYGQETLLEELILFTDWFAPAVRPDLDLPAFRARFLDLWQQALAPVDGRAETVVLRDFHVDNLMLLGERAGVARCGLLDFQDGLPGPCEYDLVSLLQDARRDLSGSLEQEMLAHYLQNAPRALGTPDAIRLRYHLLGAQRHARILGVFLRLCLRDGKPRYLAFLPRVAAQLQTALEAAGLGAIDAFLAAQLPGWQERAAVIAEDIPASPR